VQPCAGLKRLDLPRLRKKNIVKLDRHGSPEKCGRPSPKIENAKSSIRKIFEFENLKNQVREI
jgi:hypothetical protein